jgi:hypothetical protein
MAAGQGPWRLQLVAVVNARGLLLEGAGGGLENAGHKGAPSGCARGQRAPGAPRKAAGPSGPQGRRAKRRALRPGPHRARARRAGPGAWPGKEGGAVLLGGRPRLQAGGALRRGPIAGRGWGRHRAGGLRYKRQGPRGRTRGCPVKSWGAPEKGRRGLGAPGRGAPHGGRRTAARRAAFGCSEGWGRPGGWVGARRGGPSALDVGHGGRGWGLRAFMARGEGRPRRGPGRDREGRDKCIARRRRARRGERGQRPPRRGAGGAGPRRPDATRGAGFIVAAPRGDSLSKPCARRARAREPRRARARGVGAAAGGSPAGAPGAGGPRARVGCRRPPRVLSHACSFVGFVCGARRAHFRRRRRLGRAPSQARTPHRARAPRAPLSCP